MVPKVSIIIPTYNGIETIQETLQSVLSQTYKNYEVIIVDDGSTDDTVKFVHANFPDIHVVQQKNQGTLAARQTGINVAQSEFIAFLDQDDIWFEEMLQRGIDTILQKPEIGVLLANMKCIDDKGNLLDFNVVPDNKCYTPSWEELVLFHPIANSVALFRREVFFKIGVLDKKFCFSGALGDTDTFARLAEHTDIYFLNECLGNYRWSETRPGRLVSFLDNLEVYINKYWQNPKIMEKGTGMREKFVQTSCNYALYIYRLLLKQYEGEVPVTMLQKLNSHNQYMQYLFDDVYRSEVNLGYLDLTLFPLDKQSNILLIFLYLLRKDLQKSFPSVTTGTLNDLMEWASEVINKRLSDEDFFLLEKYADDFSRKPFNSSFGKTRMLLRVEWSQRRNNIKQDIASQVNRLLPEGTMRRRLLYPFVRGLKTLFFEGLGIFLRKTRGYFSLRFQPVSNAIRIRGALAKEFIVFRLNLKEKIIFPFDNLAKVAIVVSLGKNLHNNYTCLKSVWSHTQIPYKVIAVVGSRNDIKFTDLENVILYRNTGNVTKNMEFYTQILSHVSGCEYILFLDGNCIVTEDYLDAMLSLLGRGECDVVSGKIVDVYNEILLYAGCVVMPDGSRRVLGLGEQAGKPEYSYVRQIDIAAEECALIRKDVLEYLCQDQNANPDSSLGDAIRKRNYRVLFNPHAVIKFQDAKMFKAYVEGEIGVQSKQDNLGQVEGACCIRILVLDDFIPSLRYGSGFPRLYELLLSLAKLGYRTTFFPIGNPTPVQPETKNLQEMGVEVFWGKYADFGSFAKMRYNFYDVVLISRPHVFERLRKSVRENFPDAVLVYDAEALFFAREELKFRLYHHTDEKEISGMAQKEMNLLEMADTVISVSTKEALLMRQNSSQTNIHVWGHIQNVKHPPTGFSDRKDVLFLGSFFAGIGSPNEDAILYFAKEIFPSVYEETVSTLHVVGSQPTDLVKELASDKIKIVGYVENLEDYFYRCRVNVVPTRFAAGIPLKLLQAMGHGIPSVVSSTIAEQLELQDGEQVLVASTPQEFAKKIISLYSQEILWNKLSQNSIHFVEANFSRRILQEKLDFIIKESISLRHGMH